VSTTVLIIDGDEWVATVLAKLLRERGHAVHVELEAKKGFERACALLPDCIVCNVELPDLDGYWVARRVRTEGSRVSRTPFVFLTNTADKKSRLQGLHVGADSYLQRPFTNEEVVAQVEALIEMVARLRESDVPAMPLNQPSSRTIGIIFKGDIARMSIPTVLTMLEMEHRSGELLIENDHGPAAIFFLDEGACVGARYQNQRALIVETLRHVLEWKQGKFTFMVTEQPPANAEPGLGIAQLLLEAARLNDEAEATDAERDAEK
jgi:two-component system OmpR family response regulator